MNGTVGNLWDLWDFSRIRVAGWQKPLFTLSYPPTEHVGTQSKHSTFLKGLHRVPWATLARACYIPGLLVPQVIKLYASGHLR